MSPARALWPSSPSSPPFGKPVCQSCSTQACTTSSSGSGQKTGNTPRPRRTAPSSLVLRSSLAPGKSGLRQHHPRLGSSFGWRSAAGSGRQRDGCDTVYSPARTASCAAKLRRQSIICSPPASSPEKFGSAPFREPTCSSLHPDQTRVSVSGGSRQDRQCPRLFGVLSTAWFCWCLGNSGKNETAEPSTEPTNRPIRNEAEACISAGYSKLAPLFAVLA